jgi:hypothetical protein
VLLIGGDGSPGGGLTVGITVDGGNKEQVIGGRGGGGGASGRAASQVDLLE